MTCRWVLRILRHSRADSSVEEEPRVKVSAKADSNGSVPCKGRLKSVEGRLVNSWLKTGKVKVDSICIYKASN